MRTLFRSEMQAVLNVLRILDPDVQHYFPNTFGLRSKQLYLDAGWGPRSQMRSESDANRQENNNSDCVSLLSKDAEAGGRGAEGSMEDFKYWSDMGK